MIFSSQDIASKTFSLCNRKMYLWCCLKYKCVAKLKWHADRETHLKINTCFRNLYVVLNLCFENTEVCKYQTKYSRIDGGNNQLKTKREVTVSVFHQVYKLIWELGTLKVSSLVLIETSIKILFFRKWQMIQKYFVCL